MNRAAESSSSWTDLSVQKTQQQQQKQSNNKKQQQQQQQQQQKKSGNVNISGEGWVDVNDASNKPTCGSLPTTPTTSPPSPASPPTAQSSSASSPPSSCSPVSVAASYSRWLVLLGLLALLCYILSPLLASPATTPATSSTLGQQWSPEQLEQKLSRLLEQRSASLTDQLAAQMAEHKTGVDKSLAELQQNARVALTTTSRSVDSLETSLHKTADHAARLEAALQSLTQTVEARRQSSQDSVDALRSELGAAIAAHKQEVQRLHAEQKTRAAQQEAEVAALRRELAELKAYVEGLSSQQLPDQQNQNRPAKDLWVKMEGRVRSWTSSAKTWTSTGLQSIWDTVKGAVVADDSGNRAQ